MADEEEPQEPEQQPGRPRYGFRCFCATCTAQALRNAGDEYRA